MSEYVNTTPSNEDPSSSSEASAPAESGPGGPSESFMDSPVPDHDPLASRYKEMQASYTQKTQALADQREELAQAAQAWELLYTDPDFQRQALESLGFELPDDQEEEGYYEPDDYAYDDEPLYEEDAVEDPRVAELWESEQHRRAETIANEMKDHVWELEVDADVELTDKQRFALLREAADEWPPDPGRTEQLFEEMLEDVRAQQDQWQKSWLDSKDGIPHVSKNGQQGSETFDIRDRDQRINRLKSMIEAG